MKRRIFLGSFLALCALAIIMCVSVAVIIHETLIDDAHTQNRVMALALKSRLQAGEELSAALAVARSTGARVTLIDGAGDVITDSEADASQMENHAAREEFAEALKSGAGYARRASPTLGVEFLYCAVRLDDGRVLRVSRAQSTALGLLSDVKGLFILAPLIAMALAALAARYISSAAVKPLAALNLDNPLENEVYGELTPLLKRIHDQQQTLTRQIGREKRRAGQIEQITRDMSEGLVILSAHFIVLSINESARRMLLCPDAGEGAALCELNRGEALSALTRDAESGREARGTLEIGGRVLSARISPVMEEGAPGGYVLMLLDITQTFDAERTRREFSANVSHEMMTPLTSISGYAELIQGGIARNEDINAFAGKIRAEAQRMITLVEDIIRLSGLDEGASSLPREEFKLIDVAREAFENVSEKARARDIQLTVEGDDTRITSERRLVWEIIYNLADNAVKYNKPGGKVRARVTGRAVSVEDTGIGIPADKQQKVFERFYRVDKSRSKATGGTGLGLSIVKHACEHLGARVRLTSEEGAGTTVEVIFE